MARRRISVEKIVGSGNSTGRFPELWCCVGCSATASTLALNYAVNRRRFVAISLALLMAWNTP